MQEMATCTKIHEDDDHAGYGVDGEHDRVDLGADEEDSRVTTTEKNNANSTY